MPKHCAATMQAMEFALRQMVDRVHAVAAGHAPLPGPSATVGGMVAAGLSGPATAPVLALPAGASLPIEWHGALRWVQAPLARGDALREAARAVGGRVSLFGMDGADEPSATGPLDLQSPALAQIHARLKHSFDPAGIFNPGRMAPQW
jgi:FAD/FMN-containing dehydrogenase